MKSRKAGGWRYILSAVFFVSFIVLCIYIASKNRIQVESITLPWLGTYADVPLIVVLLTSMLSGMLVTFGIMLVKDIRRSFKQWVKAREDKHKGFIEHQYAHALELMAGGHPAEAATAFNKVLSKQPRHVESQVALGDICFSTGDWDRAAHYHSQALELNVGSADIMLKLSQDYQRAGKIDGAVDVLQRIIQSDGSNLTALSRLRNLYCNQGHWDRAYELQQQVVSLTRDKSQKSREQQTLLGLKYELAATQAAQEQKPEAIKMLKDIIKQDKHFIPAYIQLVDIYQQQQEYSNAYQVIEKGYKQNHSPVLLKKLEEVSLSHNDPQRAIKAYRKALQERPQDFSLHLFLGMLYLKLEMLDEAKERFQYMIQQGQEFPLLHYELAKVHKRQKHYEASCDEYKRAFKSQEKQLLRYTCGECGAQLPYWEGRCHHCGLWNTINWRV